MRGCCNSPHFNIYFLLNSSKTSFESLKKLSSPQRSKSPIIAKRFFARVAATFKIFAACAAHWAELLELLSQPNNNITEFASFPWNLWTVPRQLSHQSFTFFSSWSLKAFLISFLSPLMTVVNGEITYKFLKLSKTFISLFSIQSFIISIILSPCSFT